MIVSIGRILRRFRRDENGVVLILFTLMIVPILLVVAVAIDYSQVLVIKRQLTGAVDAAALTVAQMPDLDDDEAKAKAESYIRAHYPAVSIGTLKSFNVVRGNGTVDVTATADMDTTFLKVAGTDKLEVTVNSQAVIARTKLEVVLVLDNTGSMDWVVGGTRKIEALKTAANSLVDILFGDAAESTTTKVALVPFANAVNVGGLLAASQLDTANPAAINTEHVAFDTGGTPSVSRLFSTLRSTSWGGCVRARTEPHDLTDTAPSGLNPATLFTPYFAPDAIDGYTNSYISAPQGEPAFKAFSYYAGKTPSGGSPNYDCPSGTVQPLTNVKSTITTAIGRMTPDGSTVIPEGLAWGWRVVSPGAPFSEGVPYTDQDTVKVIVLLTDGENNVTGSAWPGGPRLGPHPGPYKTFFSAYGYASVGGHLGPADGSQANAKLDEKTASLCANIKANKDDQAGDNDILLYTLTFGDLGSATESLMRNCASEPSKYFNAPSAEDLQTAFQTIGYGLSRLRLAR